MHATAWTMTSFLPRLPPKRRKPIGRVSFRASQGPLCASHPRTCQALAEDAVRSGAKLVRGVAEVRVQTGRRPSITFLNGAEREVRPRLIIGADGRASTVRRQSGIHLNKAPATHVVAGLLVEGASRWPDNECTPGGVEGDLEFYVFPQGDGRLRLYTCHANEQASRWAGRAGAQRFVEAFAGLRSIPESRGLGDVTPAGPCGTFSGEQTWCDEPYADGVVLLGDAGGYDDPVTGQGLSLAMRDVRQLSGLLLTSGDWTVAALRQYGEQRAERLRRMRQSIQDLCRADDHLYRRRPRSARAVLCSLRRWPGGRPNGPGRAFSRPGPHAQGGIHRPAPRIAAGLTSAARC